MELYMIRHGESESNAADTHSGWSPVSLTEKGVLQAEAAARLLRSVRFDQIFVSDVKRAQQTADVIFPNRKYIYLPLMREMNNTSMRGKTKEDMEALFGEAYLSCRRRFDYAPLGIDCESGAHFLGRAKEVLDFFARQQGETIAAVSHAGLIRACAACVLGTPTHNPPLACDNASVSVFELRNGKWRLRAWNLIEDVGY